ncbi:MAG: IS630 family transposase [Chloroflexi bacterium]|nr:IS630 family transposase [Chloroflexota bacterium]
MNIKIAFRGATVKALRMAWQQALRAGNKRLVTRISALLHLSDGRAVAEVAERVGAGESTVYAWLRAFILRRFASLCYGISPGRPRKLTPTQRDRLKALVAAGPRAAGYPSGCWSSLMLQDLVYREFGMCYNAHYLCTLLRNLGFSYQKARFISDHLDEERRRVWIEDEWPALLRTARRRGALLLCGDEASFAQWGSLSYTWAPVGQQPLIPTCGKRKAYKVFGLIDYFTGRLFAHGQTARFTAATYGAFLETVLDATDQPLMLIQDWARYHTAVATNEFIAAHADRLSVYQLPSYSPDDHPIAHLWKNMKKRTTHNRYFPEFDLVCASVEEGLAYFQAHPAEVKRLMGTYLDQMAALVAAA